MLVLLTAMHVKRPLDLSLPTLLLVMTVFACIERQRDRLVLLHAYAGMVIELRHFVIGGRLVAS